jgi:hypothetical protein
MQGMFVELALFGLPFAFITAGFAIALNAIYGPVFRETDEAAVSSFNRWAACSLQHALCLAPSVSPCASTPVAPLSCHTLQLLGHLLLLVQRLVR